LTGNGVGRLEGERHMSADGMTAADIAAVEDHLAMLRINNLVPTRHGIPLPPAAAMDEAMRFRPSGRAASRQIAVNHCYCVSSWRNSPNALYKLNGAILAANRRSLVSSV
jgi:hypothetical protein